MNTTVLQTFCYITTWTLFPLGIVSCLFRMYCCKFVTRTWKPEDYMSIAVGMALVGCLAFFQTALSLGCGGPEPNKCNYFDPGGDLMRYLYVMAIYYCAMHFLIKSAFLTYYLRLSPNRKFRLWVGVGFGLNIGLLIINVLIIVFQCIPVAAALTIKGRLTAQCMNQHFVLMAPAVVNVLLDIYVFILPIPILAKLQMPTRKKMAVISVFAFGGASVIMGVIRFHTLLALLSILNTSHGFGETIIVIALELNLAAIAVNLPAVRSIWVKKSKARKTTAGYIGEYGSTKRQTTNGPATPEIRTTHELSQVSRPIKQWPLKEEREADFDTSNLSVPRPANTSTSTPAQRHVLIVEQEKPVIQSEHDRSSL